MKLTIDYLEELETKEVIYIFLSIPIVVFIIYYNFVYPKLDRTHKNLITKRNKQMKQLKDVSKEIRNIKNSKNLLIPTRKKLEALKEDYKYIKYSFDKIRLLHLEDKRIYIILSDVLEKAKKYNLYTSFNIEWDKQYSPFTKVISITINGKGNFVDIIKYLQYIEHLNVLEYTGKMTISIDQDEKQLVSTFVAKTKAKASSLSFVVSKYSNKDIEYLQNLANQYHVSFSNKIKNLNDIAINYTGDYFFIKSLVDAISGLAKGNRMKISSLNVKLFKPKDNSKKLQQKQQNFSIQFNIMGMK